MRMFVSDGHPVQNAVISKSDCSTFTLRSPQENVNNFAILRAFVIQLMQSIGSENALIIQKFQLRTKLGSILN